MARAVVTDDYYAILEVSQFASLESIRESYKKLALKFHPDKNKDETATSDFQRLSIAWETLKDRTKRAEYDRNFVKITKRKREDVARDEAEGSRRRPNEFERETSSERANGDESSRSAMAVEEAMRRNQAQAWQSIARGDYVSRLQKWIDFREQRIPQVLELQRTLHQQEADLAAQTGEEDEYVTRRFQEAIARSCLSGQRTEDHSATLAKLLEARTNYALRLAESVTESRKRLEQLIAELESDRRRYEEEEARARALRIGRALELLGPRDLNAPLFSLIDRRGKAINFWKALSRIKSATKFPASLQPINEGPWHMPGDWERVAGEQTCGRCGGKAFHLIAECGPAQCPGCGMIACINCHRSLMLLQEYDDWITSPLGVLKDSLFSVVFDCGVKPTKLWSDAPGFDGAFDTSRI
jgi:curved DNA-binding protein CbpA